MIIQRAYRFLQLAFPADVRREHGDEMRAVFERMLRARTGLSRWSFVGRALMDAVAEGLSERWRRLRKASVAPGAR